MASIGKKYVHRGSWGTSDLNNIGPHDGKAKTRVVYEISLEGIGSNYERNKLKFSSTIEVPSTPAIGATIPSSESFLAILTDKGPSTDTASVQGHRYDEVEIFESVEDYLGSSFTGKWEFDLSEVSNEAQSVYVWIYNNNSTSDKIYHTYKSVSATASETSTRLYGNVTTGTVTAGTTFYKPGQTITASWSKCSNDGPNTVQSITAYYKLGSIPTPSSPGTEISSTISDSDTSVQFILPSDSKRGLDIYVAIKAFGSKSGFDGKLERAKIGSVNNLPDPPTISVDGNTVKGNTSVNFTVTKGRDKDSQDTHIYYKINKGPRQELSGTKLTISTSTETKGIVAGPNTLYFYTNDGVEDSTDVSEEIEVIYNPVLKDATIDYSSGLVKNGYGDAKLVKSGIITYELERDVSNPTALFQIKTAMTSSGLPDSFQPTSLSHNIDNSSKKIFVDILNSNSIPAGSYFEIQVAIQDDYGTSEYKTLSIGQKPNPPLKVSSINLTTDGTSRAKTNYFNNKVTISFKNPSADAARPDITSIKIYADSKEFTCSNIAEGANPSVTLDLSTISRNKAISFSVELTDAAGQKVTSNASTTLTRTSEIKFKGTEWDVNPTTFKPYTTTSNLVLAPTTATTTGTDSTNINYLYKININNTEKSLSSKKTSAEDLRNLINSIIPENARNTSYTGIITVTAVDGFDVSVSLPQKNITIDYVESPYFSKTNSIKIKHDFYTGTTNITTSTGTEVTSALAQNHATRLFNPDEGIIFMLPKATDYNNDISKYQIYISRNSLPSTSTIPLADASSATYEEAPWLVLTPNQLTVSDDDYYYYRYKASQYNQNQYYYFKLIVEDSKGNKTEARYSNTYIIGCRITKPVFSTGVIKYGKTDDSITLNYNLLINDLGGSSPITGWNKGYYEKYTNIDKVYLKIDISPESSFESSSVKTSDKIPINSPLSNPCHQEYSFGDISGWSKVFARFSVIIEYAWEDSSTPVSRTSDYFIDAYVGNVPTVSHRSHWVGVNTNTQNSGEVFAIESYSGNEKIILRHASNGKTITINLADGTINGLIITPTSSGAVIDCGTW